MAIINGTVGDDFNLVSFNGGDEVYGLAGDDMLTAAHDNVTLYGGSGTDVLFSEEGADSTTMDGGSGGDVLAGGGTNDTIWGGDGNDKIFGGSGNDWIDGGNGDDKIHGGKGDDTIYGGAGNDRIKGGSGDDLITGGAGADKLTGNSGNDHFIYLANSDSPAGSGWDRITDFTQGHDEIDLVAFRGADDLVWNDGNVATEFGVWFTNSGKSTFVFADTNGDSTADLKIELEHTPGLNLTVDDFIGVSEAQQVNNAPVAVADNVITNVSPGDSLFIPEWALLANDSDPDGNPLAVTNVGGASIGDTVTWPSSQPGFVDFFDDTANDPSIFTYEATDELAASAPAIVSVTQDMDAVNGSGVLNGTLGNDILVVGPNSGPMTLVGSGGNDILFGGDSGDIFDYNALSDRGTTGDVIGNFQKGSDDLDLHELLATFSGYTTETAFSGGYLNFAASGSDTLVQVDSDGTGGADSFQTLATITGVTLTSGDTGDFIL